MNLKLEDKVYLVTGGSKGIGRAIVLNLLEEGALVAACARNKKGLDELRNSMPAHVQSKLLTLEADILDISQMERAIATIVTRFGTLNGVVANAGSGCGRCLRYPDGRLEKPVFS